MSSSASEGHRCGGWLFVDCIYSFKATNFFSQVLSEIPVLQVRNDTGDQTEPDLALLEVLRKRHASGGDTTVRNPSGLCL